MILAITGYFSFIIGLALSFTLIGACFGIPMIIVGLPIGIWGNIWMWQGRVQRAEEAIATGVQLGIQKAAAQSVARPPAQVAPPPLPQSTPLPPPSTFDKPPTDSQ